MHLQIKPGLRTVWRGPATVQVGLDDRRGVVLDGLTAADADLITRLRGGLEAAEASGTACTDPQRARRLLHLLSAAQVLVGARAGRAALARLGPARHRLEPDALVWSVVHPGAGDGWDLIAARVRRSVEIVGAGRTGTALATTLAAAGVGEVTVRDGGAVRSGDVTPAGAHAADVGLPREQAAARAIGRVTGTAGGPPAPLRPRAVGAARRDLVVLVEHAAADAVRADPLVAGDVPHLSVVLGEAGVVVGPLVVPGQGPCLRCLDLHRRDRDPAWPRLLAQLLAGGGGEGPEETASCGLAASLAALQVLGHLDALPGGPLSGDPPSGEPRRRPAALGATLEVELPDGLVSRRPWPAHPGCGCTWPPAPRPATDHPAESDAGHAPQDLARAGTMLW